MSKIRRLLLTINQSSTPTLVISAPESFYGHYFYCTCKYDGVVVTPIWSITSGSSYASINEYGRVDITSGISDKTIVIQCEHDGLVATASILISYDNQLIVEGPDRIEGTSGNVIARYNSNVVTPTWSITSGSNYATIDSAGVITVLSTGTIMVRAFYSGYPATKSISVVYVEGTSSQTIVDEDGSVTTETTTTTTDPDTGAITESSTATTVHEDGSISETNSTTITQEDGSSETSSTTMNQDGTSSHMDAVTNVDGSSSSTTTSYDANGDPTDRTNQDTDVLGNENTQNIIYEDGEPVVTGYVIDTSGNTSGTGEEITGSGVDTEFLPFNGSAGVGFVLHIYFHTVKTQQPNPPLVVDTEDTGSNYLFNIMTAKSPFKPWRGFHIRWTLKKTDYTSGNLEFGYTSATATSTSRSNITQQGDGNYDITVTYDPNKTVMSKKFTVRDNRRSVNMVSNDTTFETNDLDFLLGYALNQQGDGYRYSNVTIYDFSIEKLSSS